ncbi:MAG TPA: helix-turn-helix domain-containing protein [Patescibacteria group bacterium]|nr:helix-turn-helix domain-containing protein [Patescibacteria group bacterium]
MIQEQTNRPQSHLQESPSIRLGTGEAARFFGVHPRTIHRAIKENKLRYIVVRNRYKILFSSLVQWSQSSVKIQHKRDTRGIGQWVDKWKIKNTLYSPRPPKAEKDDSLHA